MIALYRPGPMENIDTFINAKYGRVPISYPHPSLKELLDETYGIIVYQDQVLLILQQFAGYSLGSADIVRKAMGKKIASLMAQERERFVAGARTNGFEESTAVDIFNLIEPFAGYAFNKAHSVSYAMISYWTAYFKAHYPLEYMASVLNARMDHPDKVVTSINECFRLGIPVLLPDINKSEEDFAIDKGGDGPPGLRMGLAAIKTVGAAAVRPLVEERNSNGSYGSIDDFCRRADPRGLNRRTMESLIRAGAFDSLGPRGAVLEAVDLIIATAQREARTRDSGQTSLFGGSGDQSAPAEVPGIALSGADVPVEQKAVWERELLGLALSHNPLQALAGMDAGDALNSLDQLDEGMEGQTLSLLGHVSALNERYTRDQKKFYAVTLDLLVGPVEVVVWPDVLERTQQIWQEGKLVRATGKLRIRGDQYSLACQQAQDFSKNGSASVNGATNGKSDSSSNGKRGASPHASTRSRANGKQLTETVTASPPPSRIVTLGVSETDDAAGDAQLLREVISVLLEYPGKDRINLGIRTGGRKVVMELPVVTIGFCDPLRQRLEALLGSNAVGLNDGPEFPDADLPA